MNLLDIILTWITYKYQKNYFFKQLFVGDYSFRAKRSNSQPMRSAFWRDIVIAVLWKCANMIFVWGNRNKEILSREIFACSKSTIETVEKSEICSKLIIKTAERQSMICSANEMTVFHMNDVVLMSWCLYC